MTWWRGWLEDMECSNRRAAPLSLRPTFSHRARFILSKALSRLVVQGRVVQDSDVQGPDVPVQLNEMDCGVGAMHCVGFVVCRCEATVEATGFSVVLLCFVNALF